MTLGRLTEQPTLECKFERVLHDWVGPFLGARGFTRSRMTFHRNRQPMYDTIEFQANWHNGVTSTHGYFVNVGIGSTDVDAACSGVSPQPPAGHLLDRRWESVVPELPYELRFARTTDTVSFADDLCTGLGQVVDVLDQFDCTSTLVEYAVERNRLIAFQRTCCYLSAVGDLDTLAGYVGLLRKRFGRQDRWANFNRDISRVTGAHASELVGLGLLDPVDQT